MYENFSNSFTYIGDRFLQKQQNSILSQTIPVDEIVVCDDQSNEDTVKILSTYREQHPETFRIFVNSNKLGSVKNFEKCISLCQNEIIFLSDQDDVWVPNKVERIIQTFQGHPSISVVCTNGFGIDEESNLLDLLSRWDMPEFVRANGYRFDYYNILNLLDNFCTGATMAFRRTLLPDILPIPLIKDLHHDGWMAKVSALDNQLYFLNEKLIFYRKHASQQVGNIFFENSVESKNEITNYFSIEKEIKSFKDYKKFLKRIAKAHSENKFFLENYPDQQKYFRKNLLELEKRFENYQATMRSRFPVQSFFLYFGDIFSNKRKIKT